MPSTTLRHAPLHPNTAGFRHAPWQIPQRAKCAPHEFCAAMAITPAEAAMWERGASNGGYHYPGCAKTFTLIGKAFAEGTLAMQEENGNL